ncbi:MAG: hypothetical protein AAF202_08690, partial [Pseudomonadota bacterium]
VVNLAPMQTAETQLKISFFKVGVGDIGLEQLALDHLSAYEIYPDPDYHYAAAAYFYRLKDIERSAQYVRLAYEELSEEWDVAELMALILAHEGDKASANEVLDEVKRALEDKIEALESYEDPSWHEASLKSIERTRVEINDPDFGKSEDSE